MPLPFLLAAAADSVTLVARAEPGWLWDVEAFVAVVVAVLLIVLLAAHVYLAILLKRAFDRLTASVERIRGDIRPVMQSATEITLNLEEAAATVNGAVLEVADTLRSANETIRDIVETADERFHELDAIVQVARDEAEDIVTGAASTVRGVRGGIRAFRDRPHRSPTLAHDAHDPEDAPRPPKRRGGPRIRGGSTRNKE